MDILERLLLHDVWTTGKVLTHCVGLNDDQLDRGFDVGHGTLRATLVHLIDNVEVWTDLMLARPPRLEPGDESLAGLTARYHRASAEFGALARQIAAQGRLDELWLDTLDQPPKHKSYGGALAHVLTHNHAHRVELLHILQRLGVENLIEGDVLGWEEQARA